jgi:hypothetical protein
MGQWDKVPPPEKVRFRFDTYKNVKCKDFAKKQKTF